MMTRTAVTVTLVGLVMLGAGAQQALGGVPMIGDSTECFICACAVQIPGDGISLHTTGCFVPVDSSDPASHCPPCDGKLVFKVAAGTCNQVAECLPFISRAPALSQISLAGLGLLLVSGGIWLTRKRARAAA